MRKSQKGFSLVELLVVVAILGVLAAIAIPAYNGYRNKAYRSAAKAALVEGAQNMERHFTRNNSYAGAVAGDPATGDQVLDETDGGKYTLAVVATDPDGDGTDGDGFTITATAADASVDCNSMAITQTGTKTPPNCW